MRDRGVNRQPEGFPSARKGNSSLSWNAEERKALWINYSFSGKRRAFSSWQWPLVQSVWWKRELLNLICNCSFEYWHLLYLNGKSRRLGGQLFTSPKAKGLTVKCLSERNVLWKQRGEVPSGRKWMGALWTVTMHAALIVRMPFTCGSKSAFLRRTLQYKLVYLINDPT